MTTQNDPSIPPEDFNTDEVEQTYNPPERGYGFRNPFALPHEDQNKPFGGYMPVGQEGSSFIKRYWRPIMAWQYLFVCLFDFIGGPIGTMIYFQSDPSQFVPWVSLTLQGGGLYHMAMGTIIGVTAWSRGQEKIKGIER